MQFLYALAAFVIALGILVVVHEYGHFWVARKLGVKVLRFSVGFGKPLWSTTFGDDKTELVVAAVPLGGYVKMLDETEGEVAPEEKHRAFNRQPLLKRTAIVIAGPLFNFLFAVVAYWILFLVGVDGLKPVVGKVSEASYAEKIGFKAGDKLLEIDGKPVRTWGEHRLYLLQKTLARDTITVDIQDKFGNLETREIDLSTIDISNLNPNILGNGIGIYPEIPEILPIIGKVEQGPAMAAGLITGDRILEVSGKPINLWRDLVEVISSHPGKRLNIVFDRDGEIKSEEITPVKIEKDGRIFGRINIRPLIPDIPPESMVRLEYSVAGALWRGIKDTWIMSTVTVHMLYKMLRLEVSSKNISGPITIAQYAGYSAQVGLDQFLMFLALVSISLGVLNLLPVPILDGGHLLYYVIEAIKGSPVSEQVMIWGQQVGILLLAALMSLALYNDISRLFQ